MAMIAMRRFGNLLGGLVVVALSAAATRAEDCSVHLKDLAEIDTARSMPEYKLDRVFTRSEVDRVEDMPEKTFDVFIRFKEFGDVRLDKAREAGPATGKHWAKGVTFDSGLADLADVKTAWIKDSPDLFIVAWVGRPDGRGNGMGFFHMYVIMQLKDHRAQVLLRGECAINARPHGGFQTDALTYSHFSFDPRRSFLKERVTRSYETASDQPHDLGHLVKDEGGHNTFVASIAETITLTYKFADGKLVPESCSLVYKTHEQDELSEIAHFYLGPLAPRSVVLEANANLATKYKDAHPGATICLDARLEIRVPVPEKWLIDYFSHGLTMTQGRD